VLIYQDRRKFTSLDDARMNVDVSGRRVAIIHEDKVVTIRPHVVKSFPGTLDQLFQLGLKLGGYPVEVYKQRNRECEYRDETKELIFTRTIAQMNFLAEKKREQILRDLLNQLRMMTDQLKLWSSVSDHSSISDYLLSFRVASDSTSITGMEAFEHYIDRFVVERIGVEVANYLRSNYLNELRVWINDRYSPYFLKKFSGSLTASDVYAIFLQHPDLHDLHNEIKKKIRNDFYKLNPQLLFVSSEHTLDNQEYITEHKTEYFSEHNRIDLFFHEKPWVTEQIFEVFDKQQILYILSTYFRILNPIQIVHEMMALSSMSQLFLKDHKHLLDQESVKQLESFVQRMYPLKEYEIKFFANPEIVESHKRSRRKTEEDLAMQFELSMRTGQPLDGGEFAAKTWFKERILKKRTLSWGEKGILAYAFFVGKGKIEISKLAELSSQKLFYIKQMIQRMEKNQVIYYCNRCNCFHMTETRDFEWRKGPCSFGEGIEQSFHYFMYDHELSWEAKGLYTWMQCTDTLEPDLDLFYSLSNDPMEIVERAYQELFDQGYVAFMRDEANIEKQALEFLHLRKVCEEWYSKELRPVLQMLFETNSATSELLNVRFPSKYDLNPLQFAALMDDDEMIKKMLQVEGLQMNDPFQMDFHPLLLAFRSGSHRAVTTLLQDIRISEQSELITLFFGNVIMDEVPAEVLVRYLDAYKSGLKDELISKMLLPALLRKNKEIMEVLLKAGASPNAVIVDNKTAWDIAKEQEEVEIMLLFKQYT